MPIRATSHSSTASLRTHPGSASLYRRALNVPALLELLEDAVSFDQEEEQPIRGKGKKRAASQDKNPRQTKRAKHSSKLIDGNGGNTHQHPRWNDYPQFSGLESEVLHQAGKPTEGYQEVYKHTVQLQFTTDRQDPKSPCIDDARANDVGWLDEEEALRSFLHTYASAHPILPSNPISVGVVKLARYGQELLAISTSSSGGNQYNMLFCIPLSQYSANFDPNFTKQAWVDPQPKPNVEDVLLLAYDLARRGDAHIYAPLSITLLPSNDDGVFAFRLDLDICVSLQLQQVANSQKYTMQVDTKEALRCFTSFLFSNDQVPEDHETNIPFFYSVLQSAPATTFEQRCQPAGLKATLLPFQRRSVAWLLAHEGKTVSQSGEVVPLTDNGSSLFWGCLKDGEDGLYFNRLSGAFSSDPPEESPALGAILAEEPGLGKTLETIALMLLNPASDDRGPTNKQWDPEAKVDVKEVKTTLIVTPPALASQWADEISRHAPSLKVFIYDGWNKLTVPITEQDAEKERKARLKAKQKPAKATKKKNIKVEDDEEIIDWCTYINDFDVCIVTYQTMRSDLDVARPAPTRPRREDVVYSNVVRPRSPLVLCEWYRVVMDEVQMAKGGKTEEMVSLIPRLSSLAVSGTPARSQVADLIHVLRFLRVDGIDSTKMWKRLLHPMYRDLFTSLCQHYAIRTMKATVKDELTIPQQRRYVVPVQMNAIERHVYDQTLEVALLELGLDARGIAVREDWEVDATLLRTTIRKLRGICTHPQVGQLQNTGNKLYKPGALKTMAEVLEGMKEQNWKNLMENCRSRIQSRTRLSQLLLHASSRQNQRKDALQTLLTAEKEANQMIEDISTAIDNTKRKLAELRGSSGQTSRATTPDDESVMDKGKGKADDSSSNGDSDGPKSPAEEDAENKRRALVTRLREARVTLHHVKFLQGDVYHVLGAAYAAQEDVAYSDAETIRRDLLKIPEKNAKRAIAQLTEDDSARILTKKSMMLPLPYFDEEGGSRSKDLVVEAEDIIKNVFNEQTKLLLAWRAQLLSLLTQKITADDEADGQEYQRSLDSQAEVEVYIQAYAALIADRRETLVNERTLLAAHDTREKRLRQTKAAMKAIADSGLEDMPDVVEIAPENEVLQKELGDQRKELVKRLEGRAIKSILVSLNTASTSIRRAKDPEKEIIANIVAQVRELLSEQSTVLEALDADLTRFRKAFNERVQYFRQLQEISDSVSEVTWQGESVEEAIAATNAEQVNLEAQINTGCARDRFLGHLASNTQAGDEDEDDNTCILCRCEFKRGFFTQCAHMFCEPCIQAWVARKEGKTCPVCRVPINAEDMQRFKVDQPTAAEPEPVPQPTKSKSTFIPQSRRHIDYNMIDAEQYKAIQQVPTDGSYSEKIRTMVQHLLYIQQTEPGAKSIVFSAWADSLHIVEHALRMNGIRSLRVEQNRKGKSAGKVFSDDPDILVLLLHGERENAGLNVTCASRVFMLESVVHHGFEIQAIARIDRMGQTRSTEVYCYYAEDTVEKNILDLAARTGVSLYTKENSAGTVDVAALDPSAGTKDKKDIDSPGKKVQKGDFIFKVDDMLAILFPHMYEDVEYLIQEDADVEMGDATMTSESQQASAEASGSSSRPAGRGRTHHENAVAGPSRLR